MAISISNRIWEITSDSQDQDLKELIKAYDDMNHV